ncbi:MAG: galactosamine-6-phosphate isomerase [Verrucomicrobia bacterium]|nr:galactosamine-6-phosphate isomerase [Prolixibacteraceae bacterium]
MKIDVCQSYEELSQKASILIVDEIKKKKDLLLCTATGSSPTGTYRLLENEFRRQPSLFDELRIIKLDEWGGIPGTDPGTCESYLQAHVIQPLGISESRYFGFNSNPTNSRQECLHIQDKLKREGPIDLCILGIGMNGHIGFNEPADSLQPHAHVSQLSQSSLQHSMASGMTIGPSFGLTLGMADILQSRMIVMLISGSQKRNIVKKFLSEKITTLVPASFLWLHPRVICLVDQDAMENKLYTYEK